MYPNLADRELKDLIIKKRCHDFPMKHMAFAIFTKMSWGRKFFKAFFLITGE